MNTKEDEEPNTFFHIDAFSQKEIAEKLYDFTLPGVVLLKDFLQENFQEKILEEIMQHQHLSKEFPATYGQARQNLSSFYFGSAYEENCLEDFPVLEKLLTAYAPPYQALGKEAQFTGIPNSLGVHTYPVGEIGIDSHQDHSWYVNLVSVFVLAGEGRFSVYSTDKEKNKRSLHLFPTPGDLLLMRAPRNPEEKIYRPRHSINNITEERIAVVLKQT